MNTNYFEDMVRQITQRPDNFIAKIRKGQSYWKANYNNDMNFSAIVGNPPYQEMDGGTDRGAFPVYHHFVNIGKHLQPDYISMIMPVPPPSRLHFKFGYRLEPIHSRN